MAYTKTIWTNNTTPAIHENNLNKMEQGIKDAHEATNIKTWYESNADTNAYTYANVTSVGQIASMKIQTDALALTGMTVMSGHTLTPQTIGITPTKVLSFDTVAIDVGVGTSGSVTTNSVTADLSGVFKLRYESFLSYASNVTITWQIYKGGVPFGEAMALAGEGATVFPLLLISSTPLTAGDELELYATASASTDITILQSNGTLEKTHFSIA